MSTPVLRQKRRARHARFGSAPACAPAARRPARWSPTTPEPLLDQTLGDHLDRLFRAAWALCGSRDDAEQLVQGTYARILARPRVLRNDDDLGYLLRALLDSFVSGRPATARRPRAAGGEPEAPGRRDAQAGAEPPAEVGEVFSAIAALPAEFRDALVAIDVAGLSYGEAANGLRMGEVTLASRVFRARSRLASAQAVPERSGLLFVRVGRCRFCASRGRGRIHPRRNGGDGDRGASHPLPARWRPVPDAAPHTPQRAGRVPDTGQILSTYIVEVEEPLAAFTR